MPTLRTLVAESQQALADALSLDADLARLEARLLLQHVLKVDRAWLISHDTDALEANHHAEFQALLHRRLQGEPIAHILGRREFYGLDLAVTPATLIPRPDTETLVEAAFQKIPGNASYTVLDLGTGTGAVALAIASQRPLIQVTAVDESDAALQVAAANAARLGLNNVRSLRSDWFSALGNDRFHLIVSNPPYIADSDPHLRQGDLRFEPLTALASGADGLDDIRSIIDGAPKHLKPGGWLMLEHGYDQAHDTRGLFKQAGFSEVGSVRDLAGIERVTLGQWQA
jgi:release factor glutamine methyltransferase